MATHTALLLHSLHVPVVSAQATHKFLTAIFGSIPYGTSGDGQHIAMLFGNQCAIQLHSTPSGSNGGRISISIQVLDVDAVMERLAGMGVAYTAGVVGQEGLTWVEFVDADGHIYAVTGLEEAA